MLPFYIGGFTGYNYYKMAKVRRVYYSQMHDAWPKFIGGASPTIWRVVFHHWTVGWSVPVKTLCCLPTCVYSFPASSLPYTPGELWGFNCSLIFFSENNVLLFLVIYNPAPMQPTFSYVKGFPSTVKWIICIDILMIAHVKSTDNATHILLLRVPIHSCPDHQPPFSLSFSSSERYTTCFADQRQ